MNVGNFKKSVKIIGNKYDRYCIVESHRTNSEGTRDESGNLLEIKVSGDFYGLIHPPILKLIAKLDGFKAVKTTEPVLGYSSVIIYVGEGK